MSETPPPPPPPPPPPGPPPGGYSGGGYSPPAKNSTMAVTSLVSGIVGLLLTCLCGFGVVISIVAIVTGFVGRSQIAKSGGAEKGAGLALAGIILGFAAVLLLVVALVLYATGAIHYQVRTAP